MYSPTFNRLRDATATVRAHSPLGTPPLSASETAPHILPKLTSASTTTSSSYPLESSPSLTAPQDKLSQIFHAVRQQVHRWGDNAKWKIDLVLLDNNNNNNNSPVSSSQLPMSPRGAPGLGIIHAAAPVAPPHPPPLTLPLPAAIPTIKGSGNPHGNKDSVSNTIRYPMDFGPAPTALPSTDATAEELRQQLRNVLERQRYLENIAQSQAEQIQDLKICPPDANKAVETMRNIYMMTENEQKLRYLMDTKSLHKDMEALSRKLKRITSTLQSIETMKLPDEDVNLDKETLLQERILLKRKLHLAELRLSARDAEIEYLYQVLKTTDSHPSYYPHHETTAGEDTPKQNKETNTLPSSPHRGPPYLFQQQYSPKMRHEIRLPPQQHQQPKAAMSPLESLGIVADRMLNDPSGFPPDIEAARRSKRSIDSANALLSMPRVKHPIHKKSQDVIMEETDVHVMQPEPPYTKKPRVESPWWQEPLQQQPDARQSPSTATLLDGPKPPIQHSPHHTPPLAHAHEIFKPSSDTDPGASSSSQMPVATNEPGYRPPSPASTPKGVHRSNAG